MKKKLKKILQIPPIRLYENYRDKRLLKKRIAKQEHLIQLYFENNEEKKLHIGCGANLLEGWLNTDLNDQNDEIVFLDAGETFPLSSDSFSYVFSEHLFEHLDLEQQMNMLTESLRILKPEGVLRIATPSLDFLFNLYSFPSTNKNITYTNWAVQNSPYLSPVRKRVQNDSNYYCYVINNFFKAWGHAMIHNLDSLKALAFQIGFSEMKEVEIGASEFQALQNIEKHGTVIPQEFNKQETMVLEFKK